MALSEEDAWLVRNGEIGYANAAGLIDWWREKKKAGKLTFHNVRMIRDPNIAVPICFDTMEVQGKTASVQGVSWKSRFSLANATGSPVQMPQCIGQEFFRSTMWKHPNGDPGGFNFIPLAYRLLNNGGDGGFDPETIKSNPPMIGEIGEKYDWLICNAVVYDFFRNSPGPPMPAFMLRKMPQMASYVMLHRDYMQPLAPPAEGAVADFSFGYSFLPVPVTKNVFGYGPGKFTSAFKQFRWTLFANSDVEVELLFVVSPRSEKILDFGGFDPVYSTVALVNALTLNRGFGRWAHNKLDDLQMQVHARIYQSLIEGMKKLWTDRDWIGSGTGSSSQGKSA